MLPGTLIHALLYGARPSVGESYDVSCTPVQVTHTIKGPGVYEIVNMGPDIANIRMFPETGTFAVSTSDYPLSPMGSGDKCRVEVLISSTDQNTMKPIDNRLHAICAAGKSATLRVTRMCSR